MNVTSFSLSFLEELFTGKTFVCCEDVAILPPNGFGPVGQRHALGRIIIPAEIMTMIRHGRTSRNFAEIVIGA